MPTETRTFLDPEQRTGLNTLYAKLFGSVTSPHSTGTITPSEIGNGYYDFAGMDTELSYTIQEETVEDTRAASDSVLATIGPDFAATAATEIGKVLPLVEAILEGETIYVLPGVFMERERNTANSVDLYTGEGGSYTIKVADSNGAPMDLTGATLALRFASSEGTLLVEIPDVSLNKTIVGQLTFTVPTDLTEREVARGSFTLRDTVNGSAVLVIGQLNVRRAI